jgi:hypothetical protein
MSKSYEAWRISFQSSEQAARCAFNQINEMQSDLQFLLEQSIIIEHKQDHTKMRELREKYGFEY